MRARNPIAAVLFVGCTAGDGEASVPSVSPWPMDSGADGGVTEAGSSVGEATGMSDATDTTGGDDTSSATTEGSDGSSTATARSGEEGGEIVPCSLQAMDPNTDPSTVIDYGDGVGQIPTPVGEALLRHCGCHYTDDIQIPGLIDYKADSMPMSTWADFHVPFEGVFPMNFEGTVWEGTEVRVTFQEPVPMPPDQCDIDGHGTIISEEDFVLFAQWFDAGAPDGANWPP